MSNSPKPYLSIIIPTRNRAFYLKSCIDNCLKVNSPEVDNIEILILDNYSDDNTSEIVSMFNDKRLKYFRSNSRLSMRDNFERGISISKGEVLCFIGDDDGVYEYAFEKIKKIFENECIDAVVTNNSRYYWPDVAFGRNNLLVMPIMKRGSNQILNSRDSLYKILISGKYQQLPCMYYGFVRKKIYDNIISKQGRFFLSNQPDVYSSVALSMENIFFQYCDLPLCIAGISGKSNGGRMFKKETIQEYKKEWKLEDDIGFLKGFENWKTIKSLIIESALVYCLNNNQKLFDILAEKDVISSLKIEASLRKFDFNNEIIEMYSTCGIEMDYKLNLVDRINMKINTLKNSADNYFSNYFIQLSLNDVKNIDEACLFSKNFGTKQTFIKHFFVNLSGALKMFKTK